MAPWCRAAEGHQAGGFGIPLVPTDEDADLAEPGVPDRPTGVAGSEVEFLLECGVLGDVAFAVEAEQEAVGIVDRGGVVVETGTAVLEERGNDNHAEFSGELAEAVGDRAGQGIGEVEEGGVLDGAEVGSEEKFLGDHNIGAILRGFADQSFVVFEGFGLGGESSGLEKGKSGHGG